MADNKNPLDPLGSLDAAVFRSEWLNKQQMQTSAGFIEPPADVLVRELTEAFSDPLKVRMIKTVAPGLHAIVQKYFDSVRMQEQQREEKAKRAREQEFERRQALNEYKAQFVKREFGARFTEGMLNPAFDAVKLKLDP